MARIAFIAHDGSAWARELYTAMEQTNSIHQLHFAPLSTFFEPTAAVDHETNFTYAPSLADREGMSPELVEATRVIGQAQKVQPRKMVLLSSALIYGTGPGRKALVSEECATGHRSGMIAAQWKRLEDLATQSLNTVPVAILRPVTVLPSPALLARRLLSRFQVIMPGHDPTLQLLALEDLARAILCAMESDASGTFNVAPDDVLPLSAAARLAGGHRVPIPRTLQRSLRRAGALEFLRYSWTVSNRKIKEQLGFVPRRSSQQAIIECAKAAGPNSAPQVFDEFGLDVPYIQSRRRLFNFLSKRYWRIEVKGLEHIPREGAAVLVGTHRGFMPWDAVMALHLLFETTRRIPRFLTHPGLFKFPFISRFVTRLGGVVACRESADLVLGRGELLGVFPEGVQGAFTPLRRAYKLQSFGRNDFVKIALRHGVPIIPFVTIGSAEAFPIFANIRSHLWTRYAQWPSIPISTFPLLPFPLPSKWHMAFLPPIQTKENGGPQTAAGNHLVKEISLVVQAQMQKAMDEILESRRSVFW